MRFTVITCALLTSFYSAAKPELSIEWCKNPDSGLPRPDVVYFLDVSPEEAEKRGGFGNEVYEKRDFQARVRRNYDELKDDNWNVVDTDGKSLDEVYKELKGLVFKAVKDFEAKPIESLWPLK